MVCFEGLFFSPGFDAAFHIWSIRDPDFVSSGYGRPSDCIGNAMHVVVFHRDGEPLSSKIKNQMPVIYDNQHNRPVESGSKEKAPLSNMNATPFKHPKTHCNLYF